jgi:Zn-dependent metalloprotease/subtilisin-like proprotein convertase family protein
MMKTTTASVAALCLALAACGQGNVTTGPGRLGPTRVDGPTPVSGDPIEAALAFVEVNRPQIGGLSLDDEFAVRSTTLGADGLYHVRLDQLHSDVPVWGADIVVHLSDVEALFLAGNVGRRLEGIDVDAAISEEEALAVGHGAYSLQVKDPTADLDFQRESVRRVLFAGPDEHMRLAWHVSFYTEAQAGARPGLWNYLVDAGRGAIITWFNGIDTLAQASGPGGNAKVARTWTDALDVEPSGNVYVMETARLRPTDMNHSTSGSGTVVSGPLDPIGDAAINDAHGFAEVTLNMLADWMGHDSIDDNGLVIVSRVHYGSSYENAFWDGAQMTYGDGASTFYPLSGDVDVVAHEINHGFTTYHSDLTYSGMSGGLNESFSDIAGTVAEFYVEGDAADWDLGRDIFRSDGALRFMCDPPQDGASIGHADDYYAGLDVHYSSGVSNKAFCLAARRLASGSPTGVATPASVERAGTAWYAANASYWTASTDFTQGCQGVLDAAGALGFDETELAALRDSWVDVGVYCDGAVEPIVCDETLTGESGTFTSPGYPGNYPNNVKYRWCIQPASGAFATLTFNAFDTESGYDFVEIEDGEGTVLSNTSGTTAPPAATAALLVVKLTTDGSVTRTGFEATWSTGSNPNQPPSVAIAAPVNGATVSGDVVVSATANDADGSISRVSFSLPDGTVVDDTTSPYSVTWDSTTVANGAVSISAVAVDDQGAESQAASVSVSVANGDSTCDVVLTDDSGTLASPNYPNDYPNGVDTTWCIQPLSGNAATLTFTAFNTESGYDFVEIRDAEGAVLSNTSGTTAPPDATSTALEVHFTSDSSVTRTGFQATWSVGTPNQPPTVTIATPAGGADVAGVVTVAATAADSDGSVTVVSFAMPDGSVVDDTTSPYSVTWDSTTVADGAATIAATAYDDDGAASTQATVTVNVANAPSCVDGTFVASDVPIAIPDNNSAGITSQIIVSDAGTIASLHLSLEITHTYRNDLRVVLTSPGGTAYTVHDRTGGSADDLVIGDLLVTTFAGAQAQGTWTLAVQDLAGNDVGTLDAWSIAIQGDCGGGAGWSGSAAPNMPTVDNGTACTSLTVTDSGDASDAFVDLQGTHDWRSILRATLEHDGVVQTVFETGTFPTGYGTFTLADQTVPGFGGDAAGTWTLCVVDTDGYGDTGVLGTWSVHN